ncbi:tRNA-2-methylthio-N(6)-dimethylallyladenosine synthase [Anaerolineae bacterium]|nr:tRNA-2-methylthio-N(6)-dimethylallyladenosine synthase [Anaerolineae bacterium]
MDATECPRGTKRVYFGHNACLNSSYDFKLVEEGMRRAGFSIVNRPEDADEIIFSGCSVREIWVEDAAKQINAMLSRAPSATVVVTGCVANVCAARIKALVKTDKLIFNSQEKLLRGYTGLDLANVDKDFVQDGSLDYEGIKDGFAQIRKRVGPEKANAVAALQKIDRAHGTQLESRYRRITKGFVLYQEQDPVEFITVSRSCPYTCSFCAIPKGRGEYSSVPLGLILAKAKAALARGVRHVVLLGDEVGNYGAGTDVRFAGMMEALVNLDEKLRISIRYLEPKPFLRNAALVQRLCYEGRVELLYVSLQSGSQQVLHAMNRFAGIDDLAVQFEELRHNSDTVLYSNWMVGFPGETNSDFAETITLMQRLNLHINMAIPFSPRPDTPALAMEAQVDEREKERRFRELVRVAADMKVAAFTPHLKFLDVRDRDALLDLIRAGELVQYEDLVDDRDPEAEV